MNECSSGRQCGGEWSVRGHGGGYVMVSMASR